MVPGRRRRSASWPSTSRRRAYRCCSPPATPSAPPHASSCRPGASANNVTVISQESGDPAAVIFDAISAAKARGIDIVLADTAGRLPTQLHLMEEIAKVRRVIQKADPTGPHETLLVLDANFGQNALAQVKAFDKAVNVHRPRRHQARRYGQGRRDRRDRPAVPEADPLHWRRRGHRRLAPVHRQGFRRRDFRLAAHHDFRECRHQALSARTRSLARCELRYRRWRDGVHHRPLGRRQVDPVPAPHGHRETDVGKHRPSTARTSPRCAGRRSPTCAAISA